MVLLAPAFRTRADNDFFTDFAGADVNIGERLFLETRFSEYFYTNSGGDANAVIPGDPVVATLNTTSGTVPGPFAGQAMNCRQCHLVDEEGFGQFGNQTLGNRTYCDFASRSPIPLRDDGRTQTPRNAPGLVDAFIPHNGPLLLHDDGQFASAHDLIIGTLTGRNYGWKPGEYATAVQHIASIIRNDDGTGYLATQARGGRWMIQQPGETAYPNVFSGFTDYEGSYLYDPRSLTADLAFLRSIKSIRGPTAHRTQQILDTIADLIEAYLRNLFFSQATNGLDFTGNGTPIFNGSPYDVFLIKNNLPQYPATNETPAQYSRRLLHLVDQLASPSFVTDPDDGEFVTQDQLFHLGTNELAGLKIFLSGRDSRHAPSGSNVGNCAACHAPPAFTDFIFHNTGASQEEYDAIRRNRCLREPCLCQACRPGRRIITRICHRLPATRAPLEYLKHRPPWIRPKRQIWGCGMFMPTPISPRRKAGLQQIVPQLLNLTVPQIWKRQYESSTGWGRAGRQPGLCRQRLQWRARQHLLRFGLHQPEFWRWPMRSLWPTNTFDSQGQFSFSLPVPAQASQMFVRLSLRKAELTLEVLPRTLARVQNPHLAGPRPVRSLFPYRPHEFHRRRHPVLPEFFGQSPPRAGQKRRPRTAQNIFGRFRHRPARRLPALIERKM